MDNLVRDTTSAVGWPCLPPSWRSCPACVLASLNQLSLFRGQKGLLVSAIYSQLFSTYRFFRILDGLHFLVTYKIYLF